MTAASTIEELLDDALLARIRERTPQHDAEATFDDESFAELRERGYLAALVPAEFGGLGWGFAQTAQAQSRLATADASLALAVNMHLVWTGVARFMHDRGDSALDFVLTDAAAGEVFAFGVSEAGNDLVLLGSSTVANTQPDGSVQYTGTKIFTSLSTQWSWLGTFGLDADDPDGPRIVYGFVRRHPGVRTLDDWHPLGMRGTASRTTVLEGAVAPSDRVVRRLAPGPSVDPIVVGIFVSFSLLTSSVYVGIAERALQLAIEAAKRRTSLKTGLPYDKDPDIRWRVAEIGVIVDGLRNDRDFVTGLVDSGADLGAAWFAKVAGVKHRTTFAAKRAVDEALLASGGGAFQRNGDLARLARDVQAGVFHPSDPESVHATFAQGLLGSL
ncbi:acyl-CoA dehydrogenase family protein [Pseudoclavibacter soli]|uniref:acyl-CoA dehydrogenase family protein n=1 Tax=Pseudoclavibacter soli TaxID=452623 RepID=UPI0004137C35|nr:acyl-CoA dehydrogenase family protein [Pseudoclavibacter soli]